MVHIIVFFVHALMGVYFTHVALCKYRPVGCLYQVIWDCQRWSPSTRKHFHLYLMLKL